MEGESRQPFLLRFRNQGSKIIPYSQRKKEICWLFSASHSFLFYSKTTSRDVYMRIAVSDFVWNSGGFCFMLLLREYIEMAVVVNSGVICGSSTATINLTERITVYRTANIDTAPVSLHRVAKVSELSGST
jgi:hypothetical protein